MEDGVSLIGVETSCLATFHDELINMFPGDLDACRLARQSVTMGEFLAWGLMAHTVVSAQGSHRTHRDGSGAPGAVVVHCGRRVVL
jgi:hypothetical protein